MRLDRLVPAISLALVVAACDGDTVSDPAPEPSLDARLRASITPFGVIPIAPLLPRDPALVSLGRDLFFDPILSGNRDVSCASCHDPRTHTTDRRALSVGTGGAGRAPTPRNAAALLNAGLGFSLFWDGRLGEEGFGRYRTPFGAALPSGLDHVLAAQAMFPVTNRTEMRGLPGDRDVHGAPNELAAIADADVAAIWSAVMRRLLAVPAYAERFRAAYPAVPAAQLGFQHAANALAAFQLQAFTKTDSPFDRYLARRDDALTVEQKQGALLFFGQARCATCHSGPLLGVTQFTSIGAPQVGPGMGRLAPLDGGREDLFVNQQPRFFFRVPALRNVELTAPYTHAGAYATLEAVVRHYDDVEAAIATYDVSQLDPALRASYHGDAATRSALLASVDPRVRQPLRLSAEQQRQLVAFLKSLTDPAARELPAAGSPLPAR
ncbi:MAG TPA: cytochrome c peroxidase [Gemmatimonadaceae bacterium]|nr:cytochrome c peroxidase [Gemmatimonadaceae bacterium]